MTIDLKTILTKLVRVMLNDKPPRPQAPISPYIHRISDGMCEYHGTNC